MAFPSDLLNDGEHAVGSDAGTRGRVLLDDTPRVEQVQLMVAEELHGLASAGPVRERADDGA